MAKIIDSLVEYMSAARSAKLPAEVVQKGKSHLLDTLAAIVSGSTLKPGKLGLQHAREQSGNEQCSVLGRISRRRRSWRRSPTACPDTRTRPTIRTANSIPVVRSCPQLWRWANCTTEAARRCCGR